MERSKASRNLYIDITARYIVSLDCSARARGISVFYRNRYSSLITILAQEQEGNVANPINEPCRL